MIYLLFGDDSYRSWQKLLSIKRKYLDASMGDTDLAILDGPALTATDFRQQTQALPFLAKSRLVIVRNLLREGKKEVMEAVATALPELPTTTVLFFYEAGQPDKRLKLFQTLNQPKQAQEFPLLTGPQLAHYVLTEAKSLNIKLAPTAVGHLLALTGSDLWRIHQELEKMRLLTAAAPLTVIDEALVDQLVGGTAEINIFTLTDAFGARQSQKVIRLLGQIGEDEAGLGLLAMIAGHYRNLLLVSEGQKLGLTKPELTKLVKLHPFVLDKALGQVKNYEQRELRLIYRYLLDLDLAAKQSLLEPLTGLMVLASALAQKPLQLPAITEEDMVY